MAVRSPAEDGMEKVRWRLIPQLRTLGTQPKGLETSFGSFVTRFKPPCFTKLLCPLHECNVTSWHSVTGSAEDSLRPSGQWLWKSRKETSLVLLPSGAPSKLKASNDFDDFWLVSPPKAPLELSAPWTKNILMQLSMQAAWPQSSLWLRSLVSTKVPSGPFQNNTSNFVQVDPSLWPNVPSGCCG